MRKWPSPWGAVRRWPAARVSMSRRRSAAAPRLVRMSCKRLAKDIKGNSNWQKRTRRGAGMEKPKRSSPAARARARLATRRDLPTLGSPPTKRMPWAGSRPGSTREGAGVGGWASNWPRERRWEARSRGSGMGAPFGFFPGGGFELALPDAIGITFDQGDIGVMGEAIEESGMQVALGKTAFHSLNPLFVVMTMELRS